MQKYNPFMNIFYYYRGFSGKRDSQPDKQIEDNTTKALVNTLKYSERGLLSCFLEKNSIKVKKGAVSYDLQAAENLSRPDAVIEVGKIKILIESKIDCQLEEDQINRHLSSIQKGYLICITPRERDKEIVQKIGGKNARFITWNEIYICFKKYKKNTKNEKTRFLIQQFLDYLEAINMAPFTGWSNNDFEAFLYTKDNPKKEHRQMVKKKLEQYLKELNKLTSKDGLLKDLKTSMGNMNSPKSIWGVLCKPPLKNKVSIAHFNFWLDSNNFGIGVEIEGKPAALKMKKNIISKKTTFLNILKNLEGFDLTISEKFPTNRPRHYNVKDRVKIALGPHIGREDVEYVTKKMNQYKLFEIYCAKTFKRDEKTLASEAFLKKSLAIINQLKEYYKFAIS